MSLIVVYDALSPNAVWHNVRVGCTATQLLDTLLLGGQVGTLKDVLSQDANIITHGKDKLPAGKYYFFRSTGTHAWARVVLIVSCFNLLCLKHCIQLSMVNHRHVADSLTQSLTHVATRHMLSRSPCLVCL